MAPLALVACLSATLGAAPQEPAKDPPVSVTRIREDLAKTPTERLKLDVPVQGSVATFKTRVDERSYMLTFHEQLRKDFELNLLQRQSADWAAKCCGMGLTPLFKSVQDALERRKVRKIRERVTRELAELEAARRKAGLTDR